MGKSTLAQVRPTGFIGDLPPHVVPDTAWTGVKNFAFRGGVAERWRPGANLLSGNHTPNVLPNHLFSYTINGTAYWFYAGNTGSGAEKAYRSVGSGTDTDVSCAAWSTYRTGANIYTSGTLQSVPFLNNGIDPPAYYDGSNFQRLPDTTGGGTVAAWTCRALRAYKYHLIAMDCTDSGTRYQDKVKWSTAAAAGAVPTDWLAAATNEAGSNFLADARGEIVDGYTLGEDFLLYKRECVYAMTYVGGVYVMQFRPFLTTIGALSRNCIVPVEGSHVVLGDNDVVRISPDGSTQSLLTRRLSRTLFSQLEQSKLGQCFGVYNRSQAEIWFYLPFSGATDTGCSAILTIDTKTGDCGFLDLRVARGSKYPVTAGTGIVPTSSAYDWTTSSTWAAPPQSTWDQGNYASGQISLCTGLAGANAGASYVTIEEQGSTDSAATQCSLTRESLDFGAPDQVKLITQLWPRISGDFNGTVSCYIGTQMAVGLPIQYVGPFTYNPATDQFIDVLAKGRYFSFMLQATSTSGALGDFKVHGFDVNVQAEEQY